MIVEIIIMKNSIRFFIILLLIECFSSKNMSFIERYECPYSFSAILDIINPETDEIIIDKKRTTFMRDKHLVLKKVERWRRFWRWIAINYLDRFD